MKFILTVYLYYEISSVRKCYICERTVIYKYVWKKKVIRETVFIFQTIIIHLLFILRYIYMYTYIKNWWFMYQIISISWKQSLKKKNNKQNWLNSYRAGIINNETAFCYCWKLFIFHVCSILSLNVTIQNVWL